MLMDKKGLINFQLLSLFNCIFFIGSRPYYIFSNTTIFQDLSLLETNGYFEDYWKISTSLCFGVQDAFVDAYLSECYFNFGMNCLELLFVAKYLDVAIVIFTVGIALLFVAKYLDFAIIIFTVGIACGCSFLHFMVFLQTLGTLLCMLMGFWPCAESKI